MRQLIKQLLPTPVLRHLRAALVRRNRKAILRACETESPLHLQPVNRVEHFYHFLFDLALPLWRVIDAAPEQATFVLKRFGLFTERITQLFPGRVWIEEDEQAVNSLNTMPLQGMNSRFVQLQDHELEAFKSHVCSVFGITPVAKPDKVLLIERLPPSDYWTKEAAKKGAGASRRSIPNHEELSASLRASVKAPFEFQNVRLEEIPFDEQVRLFDRSALVVGQHGAGLANCIWMKKHGTIIELSNKPELDHFRVISRARSCNYLLHRTDGPHATVDVSRLLCELESNHDVDEYLATNHPHSALTS